MIVCIGITVLDIIFDITQDLQINKKNRSSSMQMTIGGNGANVARVLNYYNMPVHLVSPLGNDQFGTIIHDDLNKQGINVISSNLNHTPISVVVNNTKDATRTILNYKQEQHNNDINIIECELIYSDGRYNEYTKLYRDKFPDIAIVWDWERYQHYLDNRELVNDSDLLICSEDFIDEVNKEHSFIEQESIEYLFAHLNIYQIIVTKGNQGVFWYSLQCNNIVVSKIPAHKIDAIDTNGAGDVFHALFIYYYHGTKDIQHSLKIANKLSGLFVSKKGFLQALPTLH